MNKVETRKSIDKKTELYLLKVNKIDQPFTN